LKRASDEGPAGWDACVMDKVIHCPGCGCAFELSALLRDELEAEVRASVHAEGERRLQAALSAAKEHLVRESEERARLKEEELAEARAKLSRAASREAELLKNQRLFVEREQEMALQLERRVAEETRRIREHEATLGRQRADIDRDQQRMKAEEQRLVIEGLQKHIAELQRRVQQGSQQTQGEAQEIALRDLLATAFPFDRLEDVPKGLTGADLVQRVRGDDGRDCGSIVWESKRTKAWSDGWLSKLRNDARQTGAACAVLVSQALPSDVRHFDLQDGVWICAWPYAAALATVLRSGLAEVSLARRAAEGRGEKMQTLYDYVTGTECRNRIGGFIEAVKEMQDELSIEKRAIQAAWSRRERQMERALANAAAFYGDLQGITDRPLGDLLPLGPHEALSLPAVSQTASDSGPEETGPYPRGKHGHYAA
jgi:hypothetical protein